MSVRELLGKKFVRAYEHEKGDLVVLETADGELVQIHAPVDRYQEIYGPGRVQIDGIDGFDDADFKSFE